MTELSNSLVWGVWAMDKALDGNFVVKWIGLCAVWLCGLAAPAMAQSNLFLGWHIQAAAGYQTVTPSLTNYSNSGYTNSQASTGIPLVVGVGFTFALTERQVLGLTYERDLRSTRPAGQDFYDSSNALISSTSMGFKNASLWSLVLGQLIRNGSMVYTKLGYASMDTTHASNNFYMDGYGAGVGFKTFLNPFQYIYTEYNYTKMTDRNVSIGSDSFKASAVGKGGLVGIGWQF
jgi:hypothetical protein